jgi:hypothetical protein
MSRPRRPRIMRPGSALAISLLTVLVTAACSRSDVPEGGADCVSPLRFDKQRYVMALAEQNVTPGNELGVGTLEPCASDGADDGPELRERTVFALPGVARREAVVLTDANGGHGTIYVAAAMPPAGWDPDLQARLDRHHKDRR